MRNKRHLNFILRQALRRRMDFQSVQKRSAETFLGKILRINLMPVKFIQLTINAQDRIYDECVNYELF